jgi:hypothetical protein
MYILYRAAGNQNAADEVHLLDALAPPGVAAGMHYPEQAMKAVNR